MRNLMDDLINIKNQDFCLLGKDSKLTGEFHLSGVVKISSQMEGELTMGPEGKLSIGPTGSFKGIINCYYIEIYGEFEGTINSKGKVLIQPCARVSGQINTETLTIFPGAMVNVDGRTKQ